MCGIAGIWDPLGRLRYPGEELATLTASMAERLSHRGPDGAGVWIDEIQRIAFSHRRLSIIDLSETGRQPMRSADGRWTVTYNGEIYNFRGIRNTLIADGTSFLGTSDTEVLVEAISRWGLHRAISESAGMFAFAAWDSLERRLYFVRDRFGEKPLYLTFKNGAVLFSSEVSAFRAVKEIDRTICRTAVSRLIRYGYIGHPFSIFEGVYALPPATCMALDADDLPELSGGSIGSLVRRATPYWRPRSSAQQSLSQSYPLTLIEERLRQSVRQQLIADVPVGAFLSGGIDSSLIVALASQEHSSALKTFTVGFGAEDYDESAYASAIAKRLGTDHRSLTLSERDLLCAIPQMAKIYDQPLANPSQVPTFLISRFARESVKVALTGDGGDELFCGYNRYLLLQRVLRIERFLGPRLSSALGKLLGRLHEQKLEQIIRLARGIAGSAGPSQSPAARIAKLSEILLASSLPEKYDSLLRTSSISNRIVLQEPDEEGSFPELQIHPNDITRSLMEYDIQTYLPGDNLAKLDRASMTVGLEARAPLLDAGLAELALSLPEKMRAIDGMGKRPLRRILERHVPRELFERPKAGFSVPIASWLRTSLRSWLLDSLSPARLERDGFFDSNLVDYMLRIHLEGRADCSRTLWALLMFNDWIDAERAA